jgi:hypothetical protein
VGSSAAPDADAYTAQYEALRAQMTPGDARGSSSDARARGVALAVLVRDGLPAWLAAVEPLLSIRPALPVRPPMERTAPNETRPARAIAPDVLPPAQQGEVTLLLAALVLSTARSARRDPARDLSPAHAREGASR